MEWISVEDRLPNEGQFILAYGPGLGMYQDGPKIETCLFDGELWNEGGTELYTGDFTHWMPLPEPPK